MLQRGGDQQPPGQWQRFWFWDEDDAKDWKKYPPSVLVNCILECVHNMHYALMNLRSFIMGQKVAQYNFSLFSLNLFHFSPLFSHVFSPFSHYFSPFSHQASADCWYFPNAQLWPPSPESKPLTSQWIEVFRLDSKLNQNCFKLISSTIQFNPHVTKYGNTLSSAGDQNVTEIPLFRILDQFSLRML